MNIEKAIEINEQNLFSPIEQAALIIAIGALEKQLPKKIINNGNLVYYCPECSGSVWQIRHESKYCFRCGQKLEWDEVKTDDRD